MVTARDITRAVEKLGLGGKPLEVHSSLRSFGWVEGGADAVIDGMLAAGVTLLVPTFSDVYAVRPLPHQRPLRNATDYARARPPAPGTDRVFTPACTEIDVHDMGVIPATVLHRPGRVRGNHPLMSFTALGPDAEPLAGRQQPLDVYAPLRELAERAGWIVMMGVGLTELTFLHYAEQVAGRTPFIRWGNGPDGTPADVQYGGCSNGFEAFTPLLADVEQRAHAGQSLWRAFPAGETLRIASEAIRRDPEMTYCEERCSRCADAIAGGPLLDQPWQP